MFDPSTGRWFEEDPLGFTPGDPNLFRYVKNSPTNATDPSGMVEEAPAPKMVSPISIRGQDDKVLPRLRIAKYWNSLLGVPGAMQFPVPPAVGDIKYDFIDLNPDRFYLRAYDPVSWESGSQLVTADLEVWGNGPNVSRARIPLVRSKSPGVFVSDSQLLTSIKADTTYTDRCIGAGIPGAEDTPLGFDVKKAYTKQGMSFPLGKRIHLAALGSEVKVRYWGSPDRNDGPKNYTHATVPTKGTITLKVVIVSVKNQKGQVVSAHTIDDVEKDIDIARQIFAQVGIAIKVENTRDTWVPNLDEKSGLLKTFEQTWPKADNVGDVRIVFRLDKDVKKLIDTYGSKNRGVINVFYFHALDSDDGNGGQAIPIEALTKNDAKYGGTVTLGNLVGPDRERKYRMHTVLAHEIGHILDERPLYSARNEYPNDHFPFGRDDISGGAGTNQFNLMAEGFPPLLAVGGESLSNRVRLTETQAARLFWGRSYIVFPVEDPFVNPWLGTVLPPRKGP